MDIERVKIGISRSLPRLRYERGLTQGQLAKRAMLGRNTVQRIESGKVVSLASLVSLSHALDISLSQLVAFAEEASG